MERLEVSAGENPGQAAAALEFAMEGLHLTRRLSKDDLPGRTVYGG
jgi:magnesium chelatase subunit I